QDDLHITRGDLNHKHYPCGDEPRHLSPKSPACLSLSTTAAQVCQAPLVSTSAIFRLSAENALIPYQNFGEREIGGRGRRNPPGGFGLVPLRISGWSRDQGSWNC